MQQGRHRAGGVACDQTASIYLSVCHRRESQTTSVRFLNYKTCFHSTSCLSVGRTLSRWRDSRHCCVNPQRVKEGSILGGGTRSTCFQQGRTARRSRWEDRATNGREGENRGRPRKKVLGLRRGRAGRMEAGRAADVFSSGAASERTAPSGWKRPGG